MADSKPPRDLPQVSDSVDPAIRRPLSRVIEEVQRLLEFRGDPLDAALTERKAIARGLLDSLGRAITGNVTYVNTFPSSGGSGGAEPDLTPPPTVTGLAIVAGFTQVLVQFDAPTYTQGHGNLQTNIYAVKKDASDPTLPTYDSMTPLVFAAPGALNIVSIPSELNTRWHVWAKHKTVDGVESVAAAGGINGVSDTTGQDIVQLLEVMTGQIRESELHRTLAEPIRSIIRRADDAAEDALRAAVATHNAAKRAAEALLIEAQDRGTSITETRTLVDTGDAQLASTITALAAVVGTNAAAIQTEAAARADGDSAEVTLRRALATKLTGLADPSGATLGSITSGLLFDERTVRSTETGALATRAANLESSVDNPGTGLIARAQALEIVTTHATSGNSALANRASNLETTVNNVTTGVVATADALDVVETLVNHGTTGVTALATRTSTLEARVTTPSGTPGDPAYNVTYAGLQTEQSVRAALDGAVHALYTVRAEVSSGGQTMVGGFGLAATATAGAGPRIDFGVRADQFYVGAPSGSGIADTIPFIIRTTSSTENGVLIPAGVYMDSAYIVNLSAMYARFGTLIADSIAAGQINAAHLTLGDGTVGGDLKSSSFSAGSGVTPGAGWKLTPAGKLFASNAVLYGTIYAAAGAIGGNTVDATGIQSPGYTAGSTGFRFDTSGLLRAFASSGARVFDMAATGTAPVLKIGSVFHVLGDGSAYFGGGLAVGAATSSGSTLASGSFISLSSASIQTIGPVTALASFTGTGIVCSINASFTAEILSSLSTSVSSVVIAASIKRSGDGGVVVAIGKIRIPYMRTGSANLGSVVTVPVVGRFNPGTSNQSYSLNIDLVFIDSNGDLVSPTAAESFAYSLSGSVLENKI